MTLQEHIDYLQMAFRTVGLGFTSEQVETIMLTTKSFNRKKAKFTIMDAAIIRAAMNAKYPPVLIDKVEFDELEEMEGSRE
jgi:hypothetical protein